MTTTEKWQYQVQFGNSSTEWRGFGLADRRQAEANGATLKQVLEDEYGLTGGRIITRKVTETTTVEYEVYD